MITMINKNEDQLVSLGDRKSYYEKFDTTDLQKAKAQQENLILMTCLHC